jgi:hypothetical protein
MNTRTWFLGSCLAFAAVIGGLILWWDPAPPPPADALIHSKPARVQRPAVPPPVNEPYKAPEYAPMPAALTGMPPMTAWLPRKLSEPERAARAAADQALMDTVSLRKGVMSNTMFLQSALVNSDYDSIETQLDAGLALSLQQIAYEGVETDLARFTEGNHYNPPSDKFLIEAWEKARPASAWAHYSAGLRWYNDAWALRGDGWASEVPEKRWPKIHQDFDNARFELRKALKLNPKIAAAWATLIDVDKSDGSLGDVERDYREAGEQRPASYLMASSYGDALHPKWHGSYEQQDEFGRGLSGKLSLNPRLLILSGYSAGARGCAYCNHYDWQTGLRQYNRALAYGDYLDWLTGAGEAAAHLHHYGLAYQYYQRASAYAGHSFVKISVEMQVLQALCDPKETPLKFKALLADAWRYGGVEPMDYKRVPGDCRYYVDELPWGNEPLPQPAEGMREYSIQNNLLRAKFQKH